GLSPLLIRDALDLVAQRFGVLFDPVGLGVRLLLDVIQVLEIAGGGAERELLGDEEVARVAIRNVPDLTAPAELLHVVEQDDFHRRSSSVETSGSNATVRARLIPWVGCRW